MGSSANPGEGIAVRPGPARGRSGYTLVEIVIVILIIGILAALAVPYYVKTVESAKLDKAANLMAMVATANRIYAMDHNNAFTAGTITNSCNAGGCPRASVSDPCNLVACKYLAGQDWNAQSYFIAAGNGAAVASCLGYGGTNVVPLVACLQRRTGGSPGTDIAPYNQWGLGVDVQGGLYQYGQAPLPSAGGGL